MAKQKAPKHMCDVSEIAKEVEDELTEEFTKVIVDFINKYSSEDKRPEQYNQLLSWGVIRSTDWDDSGYPNFLDMAWNAIDRARDIAPDRF
jgi:hypothetical protein